MTGSVERIIATDPSPNLQKLSLQLPLRQGTIIKTVMRLGRQLERPSGVVNRDTRHIWIGIMMGSPVNEKMPTIETLKANYRVADSILESLSASEKEARDALAFFNLMTFITNGAVIFIGFCVCIFGFIKLQSSGSVVWMLIFGVGASLSAYFAFVFWCQRVVYNAMHMYVRMRFENPSYPPYV